MGKPILQSALQQLLEDYPAAFSDQNTQINLSTPDDAAAFSVPGGKVMIQTIDYLTAMVSDPYLLGRILAVHSFNDIYAKGAAPHSASALVLAPFSKPHLVEQDIYQSLAGICHELINMNATLLGGHTAEGDQLGLGAPLQWFGRRNANNA